jgi:hypothetical protein
MNTRTLRRTRRKVASTLEDVIDKIEEAASALGEEVDKAGGEVGAEIPALPEQLEGLRRSIVETAEPYRPPKRYRPYVQVGPGLSRDCEVSACDVTRPHPLWRWSS